jgi:hypothetical protein
MVQHLEHDLYLVQLTEHWQDLALQKERILVQQMVQQKEQSLGQLKERNLALGWYLEQQMERTTEHDWYLEQLKGQK